MEGGETIHGSMVNNKLVDKFIVYVGNTVIGGDQAPTPVGGGGFASLNECISMNNLNCHNLGDTIKIMAYPTDKERR